MVIVQIFELVELYLGDVLEMAGYLMVTQGEENKWLLLQSPGTELFKLAELYLGDGFKMEGHMALTLGGDCIVNVD